MDTLYLIFITTKLKLQDTKRLRWVPFFTHSSFICLNLSCALPSCYLKLGFFICVNSAQSWSHSLCIEWVTRSCPCFRSPACLRGWQKERKCTPILPLLSRESAPVMDPSHNSGLLSSLLEVESINKIFKRGIIFHQKVLSIKNLQMTCLPLFAIYFSEEAHIS